MSEIKCPKCGSDKYHSSKVGFKGTSAVLGFIIMFIIGFIVGGGAVGIVLGLLGLFAGTIGSNKIIITCLNCGKKFEPGQYRPLSPIEKKKRQIELIIIAAISIILLVTVLLNTNLFSKKPSSDVENFLLEHQIKDSIARKNLINDSINVHKIYKKR